MVTATTEIYTYGHTLSLPDALPISRLPIEHHLGNAADTRRHHRHPAGLGLGKHQPEGLASRAVQQDVESREPALGVGLETDETDTGGELRRDPPSHLRFLGGVAAAQHPQPGIASRVDPDEHLEPTPYRNHPLAVAQRTP